MVPGATSAAMLSGMMGPIHSPIESKKIHGAGEMADLIRARDWSQTPLGPIASWSETLLSTINMMLLSPFAFAVYWGDRYMLLYNDTYRTFLGDKHPRALGSPGCEVWPEAWPAVREPVDRAYYEGLVTSRVEVHIPVLMDAGLEDRWWSYSVYPVYEHGRIVGATNIVHDDTPAVRARHKLTESEARSSAISEQLSQVLGATTDAIVSVDRNWIMTYFNPMAARLYAAEQNQLVGRSVWEAFPSAACEGSPFREHYHRAMDESISGTFEAHYPVPLDIWLRIEVHPTRDGIVTFSRDVSEQRRTAAALMQTEKLAAVGRLAASIAHEINNPLTSVTNLLYLARNAEAMGEIEEYLDTAERELRRVSAITNQTLRFHRQSTYAKAVSCIDLFQSALLIYQGRLVNSRVQVEKRKRATSLIECLDGEIRQVLNNLVGNAIDAMHPNGGRLIVRSREATNWKTGQKGVALTVADTGIGMPPQVRKRVFEAFYSTKGIGGTGLGLWLSKEIIDRHRGTISLRSSQQQGCHGTVFTVFLPVDAVKR